MDWFRRYRRARAALRYGVQRQLLGLEFARFGRHLGWRLIARGRRSGAHYLLTPVNSVRYFEFDFAWACLRGEPGRCLDLSSPRLFSLYVASQRPRARITLLNPSPRDTAETQVTIRALSLNNVQVQTLAVDALASSVDEYDCIWSLSVVEHIAGTYEDRDAVRWMYAALKPGGRLILTVPVDRQYWVENRELDHYGTQPRTETGQYFFQRFYDLKAINERLVEPIGQDPVITRWFGEKSPGHFHAYVARWLREGDRATLDDPREIVDHFQAFETWDAMPGSGVCGLLFEKPC